MTITLDELMTAHRVEIPAHLEAQAEIPLLTKLQRQGDVLVRPLRSGKVPGASQVPADGIPVVRGDGGHTHLLVAAGKALWAPSKQTGAIQGTLVVEDAAYLIHPEHGAMGIGAGNYVIRRQREQADSVRLVAD